MKGSIIIPAYNEEKKLPILLNELKGQKELEVIVVCNGCYDNTYEVAKQYEPEVTVVNLQQGSKIGALNKGDELANFYPRVYLDADIVISAQDLLAICNYMDEHQLKAAGAYLHFNYANKPIGVRWYYQIWTQLPYITSLNHIGSGLYALSREGRGEFVDFPDIISDDGYVNMLFDKSEKLKVPGVYLELDTPCNVWNLIKIKARAAGGYRQLHLQGFFKKENHNGKADLFKIVKNDWRQAGPLWWYVFLQIIIKIYGALVYKKDTKTWLRDESSR